MKDSGWTEEELNEVRGRPVLKYITRNFVNNKVMDSGSILEHVGGGFFIVQDDEGRMRLQHGDKLVGAEIYSDKASYRQAL